MYAWNDRHDSNYTLLAKKMTQEANNNEQHRLATRDMLSEMKEAIEDRTKIMANYQAAQDTWRTNNDDVKKLEARLGQIESNQLLSSTTLERRIESLEKSGRKQVLKESELLARLAIVEGKLTSNQDRSAVSAGMAHSVEHFSSSKTRTNNLKSQHRETHAKIEETDRVLHTMEEEQG